MLAQGDIVCSMRQLQLTAGIIDVFLRVLQGESLRKPLPPKNSHGIFYVSLL